MKRLACIALCLSIAVFTLPSRAAEGAGLNGLVQGWEQPARTYKPHTRWWWPGNALTKADITWQLEQMAAQEMGGVEIMSAWKMYEKGNVEYLTPEFLALVKHAVEEAKRLDIEVAITFSPGWSFGGPWVPKEDQSKVLCMAETTLAGGVQFDGLLPRPDIKPRKADEHVPQEEGELAAVVAGQTGPGGALRGDTLIDLTDFALAGGRLSWQTPAGDWKLMAFWLQYTGQECQAQNAEPPAMVIDHMDQGAVQRYCDHLGEVFYDLVGNEFGKTVDSFFCDSFEIHPLNNSLLWSNDTLARFQRDMGYDLTPYLPVIWSDIGPLTPRIRYDVGLFLDNLGMETVLETFNNWCNQHNIQARVQPHYRFTPELLHQVSAIARPETEVTTARFEPIADPRKATASGARFYGRDILSAESYTFIHPNRYRTDLQDIKIATDAFLRDGITQFYNHGYFASPEMHVAPSRDMPWANRISHWNTWWKYYHLASGYVARSCSVLRQGKLVSDVLIYSPQATAWSERALWESDRRVMPYGNLAKTFVANGYDFDIVNDELLQGAGIAGGRLDVKGYTYPVLVLPRATVVPIETMRRIRDFAQGGGTVIALDEKPSASAGLKNYQQNDRELQDIVVKLFAESGPAVFLPEYKFSDKPFSPARQPYTTTPPLDEGQRALLREIRRAVPPNFMLGGNVQSDGLTFIHKRLDDLDIYFVTNLEPTPIQTDVTFRVSGKAVQRWDAVSGARGDVHIARAVDGGTLIPINFQPWESAFFLFMPGELAAPLPPAPELPAPMEITGAWRMGLAGYGFDTYNKSIDTLASWTDNPRTRHFSGSGRYEISFNVPPEQIVPGARIMLDLGQVGNIAEVVLNHEPAGVAWTAPHRVDVTEAIRPGKNILVVWVTNTLINYVTGLETPPDVPERLQPRLGKANPEVYPQSNLAKREMSETDIPPSGLLGPVRLVAEPMELW